MAFGIDKVLAAVQGVKGKVDNLAERTTNLSNELASTRTEHSNQLADLRTDLGARNAETQRAITDTRSEISTIRNDIAALHAAIEGWRAEAAEARNAAEEARHAHDAARQAEASTSRDTEIQDRPNETPAPENPGDHPKLLLAAAGIAHARFDCHRDTWSFLVELAAQREHFRLPDVVEERGSGTLNVDISGRSLIAVIDALWEVRWSRTASAGTRAIAERVYGRIEAALGAVEPDQQSSPNYPHVIVDDRPPETAGPASTLETPPDPTRD